MIKGAGKMGWTADEFWYSTPSFFYAALTGHMEQEQDRAHQGYAQSRLIAYYAFVAPDPKERHSALKFSDIVRLPFDEEELKELDPVTQEELERFNAAADRGYEAHNKIAWQPQHN